jgi:hypothetical protein
MKKTRVAPTHADAAAFSHKIIQVHACVIVFVAACIGIFAAAGRNYAGSAKRQSSLPVNSFDISMFKLDQAVQVMIILGCLSFAAVLVATARTASIHVLHALLLVDGPAAVLALHQMRYGAGKHASYWISRAGWGCVVLFLLLCSLAWMARQRRLAAVHPSPHEKMEAKSS